MLNNLFIFNWKKRFPSTTTCLPNITNTSIAVIKCAWTVHIELILCFWIIPAPPLGAFSCWTLSLHWQQKGGASFQHFQMTLWCIWEVQDYPSSKIRENETPPSPFVFNALCNGTFLNVYFVGVSLARAVVSTCTRTFLCPCSAARFYF